MDKRGIEVYKNLVKAKEVKFNHPYGFKFTFDYVPQVDCFGSARKSQCVVKFKDIETGNYVYQGETSPGLFTRLYRRWFSKWVIEAYENDEKIYDFNFEKSLNGSKVCISIDSSSLGDTLAWAPVVEKFRIKYNLDLYVDTFWDELLAQYYPETRFYKHGYREPNTNTIIGIGWYEETDRNLHRRDPRSISLQQVGGDILGIDVSGDVLNEKLPDTVIRSKPSIEGKYVCLAMDSTANAKHWHYPGGWQSTVDYLNSIGYKVVVIQKQSTNLKNVIDKTGDIDILERMVDIYHSEFLVGIGSGLSWLAWSLHKPVVMISGFSDPKCEFSNDNYRVINKDVCHGCFNDTSLKFDRGDWDWCPRLKETPRRFECTTSITPKMVQEKIDLLIKEKLS